MLLAGSKMRRELPPLLNLNWGLTFIKREQFDLR